MIRTNRRSVMAAGLMAFIGTRGVFGATRIPLSAGRRFTMDLRCGSLGVNVDLRQAMTLAAKYGFESVAPEAEFLQKLTKAESAELVHQLKELKLVWGAASMPVNFRKDEAVFQESLRQLPTQAAALQRAGVTRIGTWISPASSDLTYVANFRMHATRLRECVRILNDQGLRFGMEYVGPKTLWASSRHSFIHSLAETKELIAEINQPHVGVILDSWHWYTAHETVEDLKTLANADIIACDLNDAPAGIPVDEQIDQRRELPCATGVIDLKAFLSTLIELQYDGPIRPEPFNSALNQLENEPAVATTSEAMKKAFALIE
jgi:sugar phosphate isomerase/epimerase